MSNFANENEAIDAAAAAFGVEDGPSTDASSNAPEPVDAGASSSQEETSFTSINPEDLPDELKHIYKSMQADYTRKTQEIAPYRKLAEQGVDPDMAVQSVQFLNELNTNPEFQQAVYERLAAQYQQAGASPQEAAAAAAADVNNAMEGGNDELDFLPPEVQDKLKRLDEIDAWVRQQEEERELQAIEAELTRQEMAIRQANPNYTEDDLAWIRQLGFAHGGDLLAAQQAYATLRERMVSQYVDAKATVNTATTAAPATGHSQQPQKFGSLDEAHEAAMARALAEGAFDF